MNIEFTDDELSRYSYALQKAAERLEHGDGASIVADLDDLYDRLQYG